MNTTATTLLLELVGEMQSYGGLTYNVRTTHLHPTKSAVVGMVAAALGRRRRTDIGDLAALRMGVRIDRPGVLETEFFSVGGVVTSDLKQHKARVMSKEYLADAAFLVGLEGDSRIVEMAHAALMCPVYQLYLGRKAYPPGRPVTTPRHLIQGRLEPALANHPPLVPGEPALRTVFTEHPDGPFSLHDQPKNLLDRKYTARTYKVKEVRR